MVLLPVAMLLVPEPMVLGAVEAEPMAPEAAGLLPMVLLSVLAEVDGTGVGLLMGAGVTAGVTGTVLVSSTFLPQAPSASKADRPTATRATDLNFEAYMSVSF